MLNLMFGAVSLLRKRVMKGRVFARIVFLGVLGLGIAAPGQRAPLLPPGSGGCALKDHVYICDGAAFQAMLSKAKTVAIETHYADATALGEMTSMLAGKLGKTIAPAGTQADMIAVLIPTPLARGVPGASGSELGTLRFYSIGPGDRPSRLVWAEAYSGVQDLPWPAVVHGLITQFEDHLQIK